jgi:signal transduction histidine kinase
MGTLDGGATFTVADTGPGIPAQERAHGFDRFWRGSSGDAVAGRGIGLAVAAQIVRAHDGTIAVDGEPGRGSRFTVWLPLNR